MMTQLLATKLFIPTFPDGGIQRISLMTRLDEGIQQGRRLTLITAPPGFGKTSFIANWVSTHRQEGLNFGWLSLEESDNDLSQFWTYILAALQTSKLKLGESLAQSIWGQSNPAVIRSFLVALINEIANSPGRLVLILDDLHFIQNAAIFDGLAFLLEHLPPQIHLVLLSRTIPPLPLPRLRSRGQVTEFHQGDLRFTPDESQAFLSSHFPGISPEDAQTIHQRLEGWPAGLQLTALAMSAQPQQGEDIDFYLSKAKTHLRVLDHFSQAQSYLLDYLTDEVLNRQPEPVKAFLIRTSILERICASLCDAVLGDILLADWPAQVLLRHIETHHLFLISLDPERRWFRYQRLFGELLQSCLVTQLSTDEIQELHRRAASWYQAEGFLAEAIGHAIRGNLLEDALDWAERIAPDELHNGRIHSFLNLMSALPAEALNRRPLLSLYRARALMFSGHYTAAWEQVYLIENQQDSLGDEDLLRELASFKALLATFTRSPDDAIRYAQAALDQFSTGDLVSRIRMHLILGAMHRLEARLPQAAHEILEAQRLAKQAGQSFLENVALENLAALRIQAGDFPGAAKLLSNPGTPEIGTGFGQVCLAEIELEWDHLIAAEEYLMQGLRMGENSGVIDVLINGHVCRSQLKWAQGNPKAAVDAFLQAHALSASSPGSLWGPLVDIQRRWLQLKVRQIPDLSILLEETASEEGTTQPQPKYIRLTSQLLMVRELLSSSQWQAALSLAESIETECQEAGLNRLLVEASLLKALIFQAEGDQPMALSSLAQAIHLAAPDRFVRVFLDEGEHVEQLMIRLVVHAEPDRAAEIQRLLSHYPSVTARDTDRDPKGNQMGLRGSGPALIEPLTAREQDVLRLLADGYTNRQIADRLVMTENTVKKHTSHIFEKLMVSNRTQALLKARELGLIR